MLKFFGKHKNDRYTILHLQFSVLKVDYNNLIFDLQALSLGKSYLT